ncbi:tetraspanin-36-like [Ambystoma mexicanum]|uniref:tetraspanin-36-like n=1 Tax=Ambystoma mexicanum TaxID=8296 RepID=UPI0037E88B31
MDCGVITSKTILILLSLIFWAAAAGLSYVGIYVINSYRNYDHFLEDRYTMLPAVIILSIAMVMFIIGLIGCYATIKESRVGLGFFLFLLMIIFAAEVVAFVMGFVYRGKIRPDLDRSMSEVFKKYDGKNAESRAVDYLQEQLQCCGVSNYTNWEHIPWSNGTKNNSVPSSCCQHTANNCTGSLDELKKLNTEGCEEKLDHWLQHVLSYASLVILGFAIVKFFGMLSVCVITCRKRDHGYEPLYSGQLA